MAASLTSLVARLSLSANPRSVCTTTTKSTMAMKHYQMSALQPQRPFSTSVSLAAGYVQGKTKKTGGKKKKKGKGDEPDPRIRNLKISMPRKTPAPLRFARNRALRHWTIHRAWLLWQRKERERQEKELMQIYQSMFNACEELRKTSGPGALDEGYLYRVAMEKTGIYGRQGFPIEYARALTETPAREPWNHDWTRQEEAHPLTVHMSPLAFLYDMYSQTGIWLSAATKLARSVIEFNGKPGSTQAFFAAPGSAGGSAAIAGVAPGVAAGVAPGVAAGVAAAVTPLPVFP